MTIPISRSIEAPPLPQQPASYGKIAGRVVTRGPPAVLSIATLFSFCVAGWQYTIPDYFIAGSFTALGIVICGAGACYWRNIGAKAIEQSAGDMQATVDHLRTVIDWYKNENRNLGEEIKKFEEAIAKWTAEEAKNAQVYKVETETLGGIAEAFKERVDELAKFVILNGDLDEGIDKLKHETKRYGNLAPDIKAKIEIFTAHTETLSNLPNSLEAKIKSLDVVDDDLIRAITELRNYIGVFETCARNIIAIFSKIKNERDELAERVDQFDRENAELAALVKRWEEGRKGLEEQFKGTEELLQLIETIQKKNASLANPPQPRRIIKKKRVKKHKEPL